MSVVVYLSCSLAWPDRPLALKHHYYYCYSISQLTRGCTLYSLLFRSFAPPPAHSIIDQLCGCVFAGLEKLSARFMVYAAHRHRAFVVLCTDYLYSTVYTVPSSSSRVRLYCRDLDSTMSTSSSSSSNQPHNVTLLRTAKYRERIASAG